MNLKRLSKYLPKNPYIHIVLLLVILLSVFLTDNNIDINYDYSEEVDGVSTDIQQTEQSIQDILNNPSDTLYTVNDVVDGDTLKIEGVGTLRLIGIDTPETVDPRKEVECFGKEASAKAEELLEKKRVRLEFDSSQGSTDRYGRILAYVFTENNTFFNLEMIKQGYAHEYTYSTPYKYQREFKDAQTYAQQQKFGLWGSICD